MTNFSRTKPKLSLEQEISKIMEEFGEGMRDIWLDKPKYIVKHTTNRHEKRKAKKNDRRK